jgi:hypothetical protein
MVGISSGIAALLVSAVTAGIGLPFGVPPAPEDPMIGRVAPEKCLFYLSWAGTGSPDIKSQNQTEQLMAEPEVQTFLQGMNAVLDAMIRKSVEDNSLGANRALQAPHAEIFALLRHICVQPGVIFLSGPNDAGKLRTILRAANGGRKSPHKDATKERKAEPDKAATPISLADLDFDKLIESEFEGGMVVALGSDAPAWNARVKKGLNTLLQEAMRQKKKAGEIVSDGGSDWHWVLPTELSLVKTASPFFHSHFRATFGVHGEYLILATSESAYNGIVARTKQPPPQWWSDIPKQLPIDRRSVMIYADLRAWSELIQVVGEAHPSDSRLHDARTVVEILGLSQARAWIEVWGLDGRDFANRALLLCDGEPGGLLRLISDKPLKPEDLSPIPQDASAAMAFRFDAQQAMEIALAAIEKMDPKRKAEAMAMIEQTQKTVGVDLRHGALKAMGDTWCVYSSPGEGYWPIAVVSLRDWAGMNLAYSRLMALAKQWAPASNQPKADPTSFGEPRLERFRFAENDVYCLNFGYLAPSWCMTKRELVFALSPQSVKAYLTHDESHRPISRQSAAAQLFSRNGGPTVFAYLDISPLSRLYFGTYGQICGPIITNLLRAEGIEADLSLVPSAPSLFRHIGPTTGTVRRTPYGIEFASHGSIPMPSMTVTFLLMGAVAAMNGNNDTVPLQDTGAEAEKAPSRATHVNSADPAIANPKNKPKNELKPKKEPKR